MKTLGSKNTFHGIFHGSLVSISEFFHKIDRLIRGFDSFKYFFSSSGLFYLKNRYAINISLGMPSILHTKSTISRTADGRNSCLFATNYITYYEASSLNATSTYM